MLIKSLREACFLPRCSDNAASGTSLRRQPCKRFIPKSRFALPDRKPGLDTIGPAINIKTKSLALGGETDGSPCIGFFTKAASFTFLGERGRFGKKPMHPALSPLTKRRWKRLLKFRSWQRPSLLSESLAYSALPLPRFRSNFPSMTFFMKLLSLTRLPNIFSFLFEVHSQ